MEFILMHKRKRVAKLELDDATGVIRKIGTVYAPEHLPVGVQMRKGVADRAALNEWWLDRSIPTTRSGIREALEKLKIESLSLLPMHCWGLSLSDQYWILPERSSATWDQVNFFRNDFSDDIGDILFGADKKTDVLDFSSPDNTSDGNLKKRWKIINGKRCLVKGGSNPFRQQPFNEVIASNIMERLGIPHVPYEVIWEKGAPYSVCEGFISEDTELVPAWRIIKTQKKSNSVSIYQHFVNCCEALGISGVVPFLDRMIVLDYIIANEDRHLNNFGVIRNAKTLEWLGFAPIYDSGSSLGYDKMPAQIRSGKDITCKPFKNHHAEQLLLVSDLSWIDFANLSDVGELIADVFAENDAMDCVGEDRVRAIAEAAQQRIGQLSLHRTSKRELSTMDDVEEDIAENYQEMDL